VTAADTSAKGLVCDADCAVTFGPAGMTTFTRVRQEARRQGWARRWISWHGKPKLADLCPAHRDTGMVI
jgi:hypothetical protein